MHVILLVLTSCTAGIVEFQYFTEAYNRQIVEGAKVLDRLASAERLLMQRKFAQEGGVRDFNPDEVLYYLRVGDPPLTAAIRDSVESIALYIDALSGLARGEAAAALTARIGEASNSLTSAAGAIATATGAGLALPAAQIVITQLLPVFEQLATLTNRAEFRRQLLVAYPDVRELMVEIRAGAPLMFDVMRRSYVQRGLLDATDGISAEDRPKLERDRELLAGWVVLIDQTILAMDAAKAAAEGGSTADLASLVEASVGIRTLAETIRALQSAEQSLN